MWLLSRSFTLNKLAILKKKIVLKKELLKKVTPLKKWLLRKNNCCVKVVTLRKCVAYTKNKADLKKSLHKQEGKLSSEKIANLN